MSTNWPKPGINHVPSYQQSGIPFVTRSIVDGNCDIAVMAIENSIAGSILPNYALIDESNLFITGESYFNINHNLNCTINL